jgi:hypothetical protein
MLLKRGFYLAILSIFILSACSNNKIPSTQHPVASSSQTVVIFPSTSDIESATQTPEPSATPTSEPSPRFTPESVPTEIPINPTTTIAAVPACINRATLVRHLSFADDSKIQTGFYFSKAWRIENSGTCTWTTAYMFVFSGGEQMNAPDETPIPHEVAPGETIDIQIMMRSPDVANLYIGDWMLRDPSGALFGTGENADQPFPIKIVAKYNTSKDKFTVPECS